jgi:tetratricopeptide (TPR) repeat protein
MVHSRDLVGAKMALEQVSTDIDNLLGPVSNEALEVANCLGGVIFLMGEYGPARDFFERVFAGRQTVLGLKNPETLTSLSNLGIAMDAAGDPASAVAILDRALAGRIEVLGELHPLSVVTGIAMAEAMTSFGNYDGALDKFPPILSNSMMILDDSHPLVLRAAGGLINAYEYAEDKLGVLAVLSALKSKFKREELSPPRRVGGVGPGPQSWKGDPAGTGGIRARVFSKIEDEHKIGVSNVLWSMSLHAKDLMRHGHVDQALMIFSVLADAAKAECEWKDIPSGLVVAQHRVALGTALSDAGKSEEAKTILENALMLQDSVLRQDKRIYLNGSQMLGRVLSSLGEFDKAIPLLKTNVEIVEKSDPANADIHHHELGLALVKSGNSSEAKIQFEKALAVDTSTQIILNHFRKVPYLYALGNLLLETGDFVNAFNWYEKAFRLICNKHSDGRRAAMALDIRTQLGTVLGAMGNHEAAAWHFREVLRDRDDLLGLDHPMTVGTAYNLRASLVNLKDWSGALELSFRLQTSLQKTLDPKNPELHEMEDDIMRLRQLMNESLNRHGNHGLDKEDDTDPDLDKEHDADPDRD